MMRDPMYKGRRPNSSLNELETRGTMLNPNAYTLRPIVALLMDLLGPDGRHSEEGGNRTETRCSSDL